MIDSKKLLLIKRVNLKLKNSLKRCSICPRKCAADRTSEKLGYCRAGLNPRVYSYIAHHGEEPPVSGQKGSGTIFFSHCNMRCVYCQNYKFSQLDNGEIVSMERLADIMLELKNLGCHNINLVTPTHYLPQILSALEIAIESGLDIPIVYNTSGYDLPEMIRLLDGIIDIYLADMRYADNVMAEKYSDAKNYVDYNRTAIRVMQEQVGDLVVNSDNIAVKGLIIRLLAVPCNISGIIKNLIFIKNEIGLKTHLSIMSQYYPTFKAFEYKEISRGVNPEEYKNIVDEASHLGLNNGWIQDSPKEFDPKFFGTNIKPKE